MNRTVRFCGMETGFMPSWENRNMSIPTHHPMPAGVSIDAAAQDAFTAEGGRVSAGSTPVREKAATGPEDVKPLMGQDTAPMPSLGATSEASRYGYESLHCDRLADAVAYARLRHLRPA